jgi:hypothetical protein
LTREPSIAKIPHIVQTAGTVTTLSPYENWFRRGILFFLLGAKAHNKKIMLAFFEKAGYSASIKNKGDAKMGENVTGKAKGGIVRAQKLSRERRSEIAKDAAIARWGLLATHKGNFKEAFGIDVDCYVLNDDKKTAVISQRGMGAALGYAGQPEQGGSRFLRLVRGKKIAKYLEPELIEKIENPIMFRTGRSSENKKNGKVTYGYDITALVDVCSVILRMELDGKLSATQAPIARQARIISGSFAKLGMQSLAHSMAGYKPEVEEVIAAFKSYIHQEVGKYEKSFPTELYVEWQRLYDITPPAKGKNWKEMWLTIDHIYFPLAKSDGRLLQLLREAKESAEDRNKKLFQFLNEVGSKALTLHIGRILGMAESSKNRKEYEEKIAARFGKNQDPSSADPVS